MQDHSSPFKKIDSLNGKHLKIFYKIAKLRILILAQEFC